MDLAVVHAAETAPQKRHLHHPAVEVLEELVLVAVALNCSAEALTTSLECRHHQQVACLGNVVHHLD